ncbi:hypothetical protein GG804_21870 [Sphingomonas histidinilytica]|jgi:hypothetical protein|uniref:DUF6306 domain-containing protein n=1 Tax=Rhizorhabdus histidinilytica TaxID=439228 RepID=A0A1T5DCT0_9SPHN|nr:DUF6306 domain-containing protein [Rhizorhabdus histidinilytica]MBO9379426.1 hypothetical protein [Rhizorhabdus histidinilytica]QEH80210.1 hypothetical protein EIK56_19635 [Sphingomonas sp. C8-2]SKB69377.1 hypothetical protein SAMN06295920_10588 [Rhizorhabdus histidinilytica]
MSNEPASPVCYAADGGDAYMGYAAHDEIVAALNELLEAERAGARVALASAKTADDPRQSALMTMIRADEARWCAMLSRQLKRLDATPSRRTGAFHGKAMAIARPLERLAFLNRGQAWVVRKLEALLPRLRDEALHRDLRTMLDSHRANIAKAEDLLAASGYAS